MGYCFGATGAAGTVSNMEVADFAGDELPIAAHPVTSVVKDK